MGRAVPCPEMVREGLGVEETPATHARASSSRGGSRYKVPEEGLGSVCSPGRDREPRGGVGRLLTGITSHSSPPFRGWWACALSVPQFPIHTRGQTPWEPKDSWLPPHFPLLATRASPASFAHEALGEGVLEQPGTTQDTPGPLRGGFHWFGAEEVLVIAVISPQTRQQILPLVSNVSWAYVPRF